jgi:hypothetical protein
MSEHPSFKTLERARQAYRAGQMQEALAFAEAAHRMVAEIAGTTPQVGLVTAWYGFLAGTIGGRAAEGLRHCREAARTCFWDPRVFELLARLELRVGSRRRALAAICRGLQLAENDRELLALRNSMGLRRSPPLSFLDRKHFLNRYLGSIRHRMLTRQV